MPTRIRSKCPRCQQTLKVDESMVGRHVRCPSCEHRFILSIVSVPNAEAPSMAAEADSVSTDSHETASGAQARTRYRGDSEATMGTIGRFELKGVLGHGGFGRVYRAYDPQLDRQVALKVPKFAPEEKKKIRRFLTEAKAAAALRHPNIVTLYESGKFDNDYYIASEYVKGRNLAEFIDEKRPSPRRAAEWTRDLAEALAYAHEEGIIHRDIKPENVMVGANGRPQIMDFGLAKRLDEDSSMTADGGVLGTPAYMSPEQARGEMDQVGPHSDQYSLGVVFYQMLTGRKPFEGPPHTVIAMVAKDDPPSPKKLNPDIPQDLEAICLKAMEKQPERRYDELTSMADDLERWLMGREVLARPIGRIERANRWVRRNPLLAGLGAALAGVLLLGTLVSTFFAISANSQRRAAEAAEKAARDLAEREAQTRQAAQEAQFASERSLVESQIERALGLCEQGDTGRGLLRLSSILEHLPPHAADFDFVVRANISEWWQQHRNLRLSLGDNTHTSYRVAFDPKGEQIITGTGAAPGFLWNAKTGRRLNQPLKDAFVVAFSPDGTKAASAGPDITIWDASKGTPLLVIKRQGQGEGKRFIRFSPDGTLVLCGGRDKAVALWNTVTGEPVGLPMQHPGLVECAAFSPDGMQIVTCGSEGALRFWSVPECKEISEPVKHPDVLMAVDFSPDGRWVLSGCRDQRVRIWDAKTHELVGWPLPVDGQVQGIAFAADGRLFATSTNSGAVQLWDAKSLIPVGLPFQHSGDAMQLCFSPDGRQLAVATWFDAVRVWNVNENRPPIKEMQQTERVNCSFFSPDGNRVYVACSNGTISAWDAATGQQVGKPMQNKSGVTYSSFAISPDGRTLLSGGYSKFGRLWNADTCEPVGQQLNHDNGIPCVCFTPDGTAVTASLDGTVKLWNPATGELRGTLAHGQPVPTVDASSDGVFIVTGSRDKFARLWNAATQSLVGEPMAHESAVEVVTFCRGKPIFFTGCQNGFGRIWSAPALEPIGEPIRHGSLIHAARFSPDGNLLITTSEDSTAQIWETSTGKPVCPPLQHLGAALACEFSPDGKLAATGSQHGHVQLWDVKTGKPIGPARTHLAAAFTLRFSPDGTMLLTGGYDNLEKLHRLPQPVTQDPHQISLWIQTITRLEMRDDRILYLSPEDWRKRRTELNKLGGAPQPFGENGGK